MPRMEEIVMAIRTRPTFCRTTTRIVTQHITRASRLVSAITGFAVQPNKAIVGANAFAHEAGIHQDGMLKHAGTYEIMRPEDVGLVRSNLVMGKHSGRHAFRKKLAELGYEIGDNALAEAFARFKALADKKKEIFDEDLIALVDDGIQAIDQRIKVVELEVHCGSRPKSLARIALEIDGAEQRAEAEGDGPVDATFNAIQQLVPHKATLSCSRSMR